MSPTQSLTNLYHKYPGQFWLMFFGMLISTTGTSMIWPYLMIFVTERSGASLTAGSSLMTINSAMILMASFIAGPITDRFGRKWIMVASLFLHGVNYFFFGQATQIFTFAILMAVSGAVSPLYRIGSDAMMADLVPEDKRVDAYALLRMSNNLGISLGPAIGGYIASRSYHLAFYFAGAGLLLYAVLMAILGRETLPMNLVRDHQPEKHIFGGYAKIIQDKPFISFVSTFTLVSICASLIWVLMPVYAKQGFNIREQQYGFIPTTNAVMVVALQLWMTQWTRKYPALKIAALGAALYGAGVAFVACSTGFWGFWLSMVIMTLGELVIVPTSNTFVANIAPPHMRGRYMSLYGLTWGLAAGIGPLMGGILNDWISPTAIWYGGAIAGAIGSILFFYQYRKTDAVRSPYSVRR